MPNGTVAGMSEADLEYRIRLLDELSPALREMLANMKGETDKGGDSLNKFYAIVDRGKGVVSDLGAQLHNVALDMGEEAFQLNRFRQQMGASITQVQEWKKIADETGTSMGSLAVGFRGLGVNIQKALEDPASDAAAAFKALGVEIKDANGKARDSQAVMYDVADAFAKAKDGNEKNAVAMTLFNRAGRELIPVLNQGSEGLKDMAQAAHDTGAMMDEQTFGAAIRYREAINDINDHLEGMSKELAGPLLLRAANFAKVLESGAGSGHSWVKWLGESLGWLADQLAYGAVNAKAGFEHLLNYATRGVTTMKGTFKELIGEAMSGLGKIEDYLMTSSLGRYIAGKAGIELTGGLTASGNAMAYEGRALKRSSFEGADAETVAIESRRLAAQKEIAAGATYRQPPAPGGGTKSLNLDGDGVTDYAGPTAGEKAHDKAMLKSAEDKQKALRKIQADGEKQRLIDQRKQDAEEYKLEADFHAKELRAEQAAEQRKLALERRLDQNAQKTRIQMIKDNFAEEFNLIRGNKDRELQLTAEYNGALAQEEVEKYNRKVATTEAGLRAVGMVAGQVLGENNAITKAAALGEGWINYRRAVMGAMASPPFPPKNAPFVMAAKIQGGVELAMLAAQTLTGGGGGGGASTSMPSIAPDTSSYDDSYYPEELPESSGGSGGYQADVRIQINNPIYQDKWMRDNVVPALDDALRDHVSRTLRGGTIYR